MRDDPVDLSVAFNLNYAEIARSCLVLLKLPGGTRERR